MTIRMTDNGLRFDSTSRTLGRYSSPQVGAFLLGQMYGVVAEDGTRIWFLRPISELTKSEREELADYMVTMWNRFRDE